MVISKALFMVFSVSDEMMIFHEGPVMRSSNLERVNNFSTIDMEIQPTRQRHSCFWTDAAVILSWRQESSILNRHTAQLQVLQGSHQSEV